MNITEERHFILTNKDAIINKGEFMKNYLKLLRGKLKDKSDYTLSSENQINKEVTIISQKLGIEITEHQLRKLPSTNGRNGSNDYLVDKSNLIYFYPPNSFLPNCPFDYYKGGKLILTNRETYSEITNLDEILLKMVRVFTKALEHEIVIDPYGFMLRLDEPRAENYDGSASLVLGTCAIMRPSEDLESYSKSFRHYINVFLDHFIGWNFGVSVNRNENLRTELEALNQKVIDAGIREAAGPGFEVKGNSDTISHGLQHYKLSTGIVLTKKNN